MNHQPEIAIVEANTLTSLGLKTILERMIPMAVIRTFPGFGELMDDTPDMYAHYFISAQIYVEHNAFFLPGNGKPSYWRETVTNSSFRASRYSTSTRRKRGW